MEADAGDPVVVGGIDHDGDLETIDDERIRVRRADDDGGRQVFGDRDGGGGDLFGGVSFGIDEVEGKPAGSGGAERGGGGISGLFARGFERDGKRDFLAGIEIQATFSEGPVRIEVKGNFRSFECLEGGETVAGEPLVLAGVFRRDDPHGGGADLRGEDEPDEVAVAAAGAVRGVRGDFERAGDVFKGGEECAVAARDHGQGFRRGFAIGGGDEKLARAVAGGCHLEFHRAAVENPFLRRWRGDFQMGEGKGGMVSVGIEETQPLLPDMATSEERDRDQQQRRDGCAEGDAWQARLAGEAWELGEIE